MKIYIILVLLIMFPRAALSADWYLVKNDIDASEIDRNDVEFRLWGYLEKNTSHIFKGKDTYKFQYKFIGVDEVHINALCWLFPNQDPDLSKEFYHVFDGGSCYFNIKYDLKAKVFKGLYVNGNA